MTKLAQFCFGTISERKVTVKNKQFKKEKYEH